MDFSLAAARSLAAAGETWRGAKRIGTEEKERHPVPALGMAVKLDKNEEVVDLQRVREAIDRPLEISIAPSLVLDVDSRKSPLVKKVRSRRRKLSHVPIERLLGRF